MLQNKRLITWILVLFSTGVVLLILAAILYALQNTPEQQDEQPTDQQQASPPPTTTMQERVSPTPRSTQTLSPPAADTTQTPSNVDIGPLEPYTVETLSTPLTFDVPRYATVDTEDHTAEDYESQVVTIEHPSGLFEITIQRVRARLPREDLPTNPSKQNPPLFPYADEDFVVLATVDGAELLVSTTGATEVTGQGESFQMQAKGDMAPQKDDLIPTEPTEYYIYQRYDDKLSEYLSIFLPPDGTYPDYHNHTLISYQITEQQANQNWSEYQTMLQALVQSLEEE